MLPRSTPRQLVSLQQLQCWLYNANISLLTNALFHIHDLLLPCGVFQVPAFTHPRSIATFCLYRDWIRLYERMRPTAILRLGSVLGS